jgi:Ca2+-binding RTX toxin-like protein
MTAYTVYGHSSELIYRYEESERFETYRVLGNEWLYDISYASSTQTSSGEYRYILPRYFDHENRHLQISIKGEASSNGVLSSGFISEISLYDVDGVTLLQRITPTEPLDATLVSTVGYDNTHIFFYFGSLSSHLFNGNDLVVGHSGNNYLNAGPGSDTITGGGGDDQIQLGGYFDFSRSIPSGLVDGGDGNDTIDLDFSSNSNSQYLSLVGIETTEGIGIAPDIWVRNVENTFIEFRTGNNTIMGGLGNDSLNGGNEADVFYGNAGDDNLRGRDGNDVLYGYEGDDWLDGGAGDDIVNAGEGNDFIRLSIPDYWQSNDTNPGIDVLDGGNGNDRLHAWFYDLNTNLHLDLRFASSLFGAVQDNGTTIRNIESSYIHSGTGNDTIFGTDGNDHVFSESGHDSIDGFGGNDILEGSEGDDTISGATGDDYISGGEGNDILIGGDGNDVIYYDPFDSEGNIQGNAGFDTLLINGVDTPFSFNLAEHGFESAQVTEYTLTDNGYYAYRVSDYDASWTLLNESGSNFAGDFWERNWVDNSLTLGTNEPDENRPFSDASWSGFLSDLWFFDSSGVSNNGCCNGDVGAGWQ